MPYKGPNARSPRDSPCHIYGASKATSPVRGGTQWADMPLPAGLWFCGMRTTGLRPSRRRDCVFQSCAALLPPPTALDQPGAGARHRTVFSGYPVCISEGAMACNCPTGPPLSRTSTFRLSEVRRPHSRCVLVAPTVRDVGLTQSCMWPREDVQPRRFGQ